MIKPKTESYSHANHNLYIHTNDAPLDDSDFISVTDELLTIQSGSTMTSFNITILGDIIPEGDEQFSFNINTVNSLDQVISPSLGTVIILNDDEGEVVNKVFLV